MFIWLDIKGASIEVNRNTQGYLSFLGSSEILQITELLNFRQECSLNLQAFKQCEFVSPAFSKSAQTCMHIFQLISISSFCLKTYI